MDYEIVVVESEVIEMAATKRSTAAAAAASPRHTPGPWKLDDKALRGWEYRITARAFGPRSDMEVTIADVPNGWNLTAKDPEVAADARLIAAAPELLEALRRVVARGCSHMGCLGPRAHSTTCKEARAAIAKATGEGA